MEIHVLIIFLRLSTKNILRMYGKIYGLAEPTTSIIAKNCCEAIKILLNPLVFKKLTKCQIQTIVVEFEEIMDKPYIIGAIDGSHVPIIAPKIDHASYFVAKVFILFYYNE